MKRKKISNRIMALVMSGILSFSAMPCFAQEVFTEEQADISVEQEAGELFCEEEGGSDDLIPEVFDDGTESSEVFDEPAPSEDLPQEAGGSIPEGILSDGEIHPGDEEAGFSAGILASGNCGTNVVYEISNNDDLEDGILTISGDGAMSDYQITDTSASVNWPYTNAPWSGSDIFQLSQITVGNGVTHIGAYAFCGAGGVRSVDIASSVRTIGNGAFWGCSSLQDLTIPAGVETIGTSAFYYCANMNSISIPKTVTRIEKSAFYLCSGLTDVYFGGTKEEWDALVASGIESDRNDSLLNAEIHFESEVKLSFWNDYSDEGFLTNQVSSLTYASGSFLWDISGDTSLERSRYDCLYMKVEYDPEKETKNACVTITLPDGFSFSYDQLVTEKKAGFDRSVDMVIPVYPVYAEDFDASKLNVHVKAESETDAIVGVETLLDDTIQTISVVRSLNEGDIAIANRSRTYHADFSASWFADGSYRYHHQLGKLSIALSAMSYAPDSEIERSLRNLGFGYIQICPQLDSDTAAYSIAKKRIIVDNEIVTLIVAPVRGSMSVEDWIGNLDLGWEENHQNFRVAMNAARQNLDAYMMMYGDENKKLLLTGHSRGAAVANLLAADYDVSGSPAGISADAIYTYTFATPNTTKDSSISADVYGNIFNFTYETDLVPSVPPRALGYNKYGLTYSLPSGLTSPSYAQLLNNASDKYRSFTGREYNPLEWMDYAELLLGYEFDKTHPSDPDALFENSGKVCRTLGRKLFAVVEVLDRIRSVAELLDKVNTVHSAESYLAWMDSIDGIASCTRNSANFKVVRVACPVDVVVKDSGGNVVCSSVNEVPANTSLGPAILVDNGIKYIFIPNYDVYTLEITAVGDGTMNYSVFEYDGEMQLTRSVNAYGIALTEGDVFRGTVDGAMGALASGYQLTRNETESIIPELIVDETEYADIDNVEAILTGKTEDPIDRPATVITGGLGGNVIFTLDEEGTMTISGSGEMGDYYYGFDSFGYPVCNVPWTQWKDGGFSSDEHGTMDYRGQIKKIVIKDGVNNIGSYVFVGCKNVTSVEVAETVTSIGNYAFQWCSGIRIMNLPGGLNNLGKGAFSGCNNWTGDITIPEGVTEIKEGLFSGCSKLTGVTLHNRITTIGANAFSGCERITEMEIPDSVTALEEGAFRNTSIKELVIGGGISEIPNGCFESMDSLINLMISEGVTKIGRSAFGVCNALTKVDLPDSVVEIGESAFSSCRSLYSVSFGSGLKRIGGSAFSRTGLYNIVIPDGVETIGSYVFHECERLTSVTIPDSVCEIGEAAFYKCPMLKTVELVNGIDTLNKMMFEQDKALETVQLGENLKRIEYGAFQDCSSLSAIMLPDKLEYIGDHAFSESGLTQISIPDSVTQIGSSAFSRCSNLSQVDLGNGLTSIGEDAFYVTAVSQIVIPDTVTELGAQAFGYCTNLTSVKLSQNIHSIYSGTFYRCHSLKSIEWPDKLEKIGYCAFSYCTSLESIMLPDTVSELDNGAFGDCSAIVSIQLSEELRIVRDAAFTQCTNLKDVIIPKNVLVIGRNTFYRCVNLVNIEFLGDAPFIDDNCFGGDHISVFYPENNETWNDNVMLEYGADSITWKESCGSHREGNPVRENETLSTCIENGSYDTVKYCVNCDKELYRETTILPLGEHHRCIDEGYASTCTEEGLSDKVYCDVCREELVERVTLPLKPHHKCIRKGYAATCTEEGLSDGVYCDVCREELVEQEIIPVAGHNYKNSSTITKATLTKAGRIRQKCSRCGESRSVSLAYPKTITLAKTKLSYNGKAQNPAVTVKGSDGKLISSKNYTVAYSKGRKNVGTYKAVITFKGNYSGKKTLTYKIVQAAQKITTKVTSKTYTAAALKKKAQSFSIGAKASGKGKLSYKSSSKKYVTVSSGGKVTIKKGTPKGTYKITVTAAGNTNYKAASKVIKIIVR